MRSPSSLGRLADPRLSSFARARVAHFTHWVRVAKDTAIFLNVPACRHSHAHVGMEPSDIVPNFVSNPIVLFSAVFGRLFGIVRFDVGRPRRPWRRPRRSSDHRGAGRAAHRPSGQAHGPPGSAGRWRPYSHRARRRTGRPAAGRRRPPSAHGAEPGVFHPHVRRRRSH